MLKPIFCKLILVFLVLGIATQADAATEKLPIPAMTGLQHLEFLAASCDDKSWDTIGKWAKSTSFASHEFAATTLHSSGQTITDDSKKMRLTRNADKYTFESGKLKFSGSLCDVVVSIINSDSSAKTSLMDAVVPRAFAQQGKRARDEIEKVTALGFVSAAALGGCVGAGKVAGAAAGTAGLLGGPVGALGGASLGAAGGCVVGGLAGGVTAYIIHRHTTEQLKLNAQVRSLKTNWDNFWNSRPTIRTCTDKTVEFYSKGKMLILKRDDIRGAQLELGGEDVSLKYPPGVAQAFAVVMDKCRLPTAVESHNREILAIRNRVQYRINQINQAEVKSQNRSR